MCWKKLCIPIASFSRLINQRLCMRCEIDFEFCRNGWSWYMYKYMCYSELYDRSIAHLIFFAIDNAAYACTVSEGRSGNSFSSSLLFFLFNLIFLFLFIRLASFQFGAAFLAAAHANQIKSPDARVYLTLLIIGRFLARRSWVLIELCSSYVRIGKQEPNRKYWLSRR